MTIKLSVRIIAVSAFLLASCRPEQIPPAADEDLDVPHWATHAVWYQIFPERFRNGDPSNDPTIDDIHGSWPHIQPAGWEPTPWGHDWYEQEDWAEASGIEFYRTVQARRYGGDLQGVIDKLDYLRDLGVTALYFNPLNDSPSLHKYDAAAYHHIDRNFGPDPDGDAALMASEDPADPETWVWTSADSLFLQLVEEVHRRDMRIVMDFSWNHTGITFWAFRDVVENQRESPYADWYQIASWNDPATEENEFHYEGWLGVRELPEFTEVDVPDDAGPHTLEGNLHPEVKQHVFDVTRRWLDPHGNGDLSKGVDGFRLDVAEMVPLGFWREYREFVKGINPDAVLIGEIWWDAWPDRLMDPEPWLSGDVFDGIMNYRWYMPSRRWFAGAEPAITLGEYTAHIDSVVAATPRHYLSASMLMMASHDTPRVSTSLYNKNLYKYRATPREDPSYKIDRPDLETRQIKRMMLVKQFTFIGAPHVYYGDEVGMWGADDPDNRKPMVWADLTYAPEIAAPPGLSREPNDVMPDMDLFRFYQQLIRFRKTQSELFSRGDYEWVIADEERALLGYRRHLGTREAIVLFNKSEVVGEVHLPQIERGVYRAALGDDMTVHPGADGLRISVPAMSASVWIRE